MVAESGRSEGSAPTPVYAYCIIRSAQPREFGPIGIGGRGDRVYTIHEGELAAVVSEAPQRIFDPTPENARAHEQVNQRVLEDHTPLPLAFGTVFRSEADLLSLIRGAYPTLEQALSQLAGRIEFGLKVSWDLEQVLAEVEREDEAIRRLRAELGADPSAASYMMQLKVGQQVEAAVQERSGRLVQAILQWLEGTAVAVQQNRPMNERMILNAAFLVEGSEQERFHMAVEQLAAHFAGRLTFKPTGPWPPYNFVRIRLAIEPGVRPAEDREP